MSAPQTSVPGEEGEAAPGTEQTCTADRHGTLTAYWGSGCRCPEASRLAGRWQKQYRTGVRRMTSGVGTARRLQALGALGWPQRMLAERIGVTQREVSQLVVGRSQVRVSTHERVADLYDTLADHRGPSDLTARRAHQRGWLVPLWWDEDTIDDPRYTPKTYESTRDRLDMDALENREARAERRAEVRRLTRQGFSISEIALRLRVDERQVVRDRRALREAS